MTDTTGVGVHVNEDEREANLAGVDVVDVVDGEEFVAGVDVEVDDGDVVGESIELGEGTNRCVVDVDIVEGV